MNIYKVIKDFTDLEDETKHVYREGDIFPHKAVIIKEERIIELSSSENKRGEPMIELLTEEKSEAAKDEKKKKKTIKKPAAEE